MHYNDVIVRQSSTKTINYVFEKPVKYLLRGSKGRQAPLGGVGSPHFFLFFRRRRRREEKKKYFGDIPIPGRGQLPSALPPGNQAKRTFQVLEQFGMTHNGKLEIELVDIVLCEDGWRAEEDDTIGTDGAFAQLASIDGITFFAGNLPLHQQSGGIVGEIA